MLLVFYFSSNLIFPLLFFTEIVTMLPLMIVKQGDLCVISVSYIIGMFNSLSTLSSRHVLVV